MSWSKEPENFGGDFKEYTDLRGFWELAAELPENNSLSPDQIQASVNLETAPALLKRAREALQNGEITENQNHFKELLEAAEEVDIEAIKKQIETDN